MSLLHKYRHIIWDWNGTLFDDVDLCLELINTLLSRHGLKSITLERYRDVFGFPVRRYYQNIGFDFRRVSFERVAVEFIDAYNSRRFEAGLYKGAAETLRGLCNLGVSHSVLSAYRHADLETTIRRLGIGGYFETISGISDQFAASKKENGALLIKKLTYTPEEILLVGDTGHDFEVARMIGVDCILISHGHSSLNRLKRCGVPVVDALNKIFTTT
ncbi:MAG: HAD family hydrolase [Chitinispirillaceae bacterium]